MANKNKKKTHKKQNIINKKKMHKKRKYNKNIQSRIFYICNFIFRNVCIKCT